MSQNKFHFKTFFFNEYISHSHIPNILFGTEVANPGVSIVSDISLAVFNIGSCLFCCLLAIKRCYFAITEINFTGI
jgi:hypothetical protein